MSRRDGTETGVQWVLLLLSWGAPALGSLGPRSPSVLWWLSCRATPYVRCHALPYPPAIVPRDSCGGAPPPPRPTSTGPGGGNRAVTSQPRMGQSTSYGDVKPLYVGGRRVRQEGLRDRGTQERQQTGGGATQTHRTREPHQEGQGRAQQTRRRGTARQERQPEQREQGTRMERMAERAHGRQRQQRGWLGQPAPSLPGARATPAQPASGGGCLRQPRWAVCATGAGAYRGQTSREGEKDIWWTARTARGGTGHLGLTHTETQRGRLRTACGQRCVDSKNSQNDPGNNQHILNTPTIGRR